MEHLDLEKYKKAWKDEHLFSEKRLTREQILDFMYGGSKSIATMYRKGLVVDISGKVILSVYIILMIILHPDEQVLIIDGLICLALLIGGIFYQGSTYSKIPRVVGRGRQVLDELNDRVQFYYDRYSRSVVVSAISAPVFVAMGMLSYYLVKYNHVPVRDAVDTIVTVIFISISFLFALLASLKQHRFHIRQLEESLEELENDSLTAARLGEYAKRRRRNLVLVALALLAGAVIFLLLIWNY